jgi:hypothetical protein
MASIIFRYFEADGGPSELDIDDQRDQSRNK